MNPAVGPVPEARVEARIDGAFTLPGRTWGASRPRALVALAHGLGEHTGRYAALAGDLVGAGYSVVALDWPGHGRAPGRRGDIRSWTWLRDRIVPASFSAAPQSGRLPHVLFGHSMGGLLALDYALAHPGSIAGVAASAPALRSAVAPWWKLALAKVARLLAPSIGFPAGIASEALSRDLEVVQARDKDALAHDKISTRLYDGILDSQRRVMSGAASLAVPALLLQGTGDVVVDPEGSREFCVRAPERLVESHVYDGAYHEVFNDLGRDACLTDLLVWLDRVVGS